MTYLGTAVPPRSLFAHPVILQPAGATHAGRGGAGRAESGAAHETQPTDE